MKQTDGRTTPVTEAELRADFRAFHQHYRARYINWASLYLGNRTDAEEAVDAAFEQIYLNWLYILERRNPPGYAWAIVKNRTIDHARARGRRPTVVDTAAFETETVRHAVDPIGELECVLPIYQAIEELPEQQRDVTMLRCLGYSFREIADLLGASEPGVRSSARFARRRLREALAGRQEEE